MSNQTNNKSEVEIRAIQHPAHQHLNTQIPKENSMSNTAADLVSKFSALRLPDNFTTHIGGEKLPLKPEFGKFSKHRFARVHPGDEYKFPCLTVEDKDLGETYMVMPVMQKYLGTHATPKILRLSVDSTGLPKIIAQPILDPNKKASPWHTSLIRGIQCAETSWTRIEGTLSVGQYTIIRSKDDLGDPQWPEQSMQELVQEVFCNNLIEDEHHPFIRQIQGRI